MKFRFSKILKAKQRKKCNILKEFNNKPRDGKIEVCSR